MVTQKDIARQLNLSPSTITKVLNGSKVQVSPETREAIVRTAKELNYQVNTAARALVKGFHNSVTLVYERPQGYMRTEYSIACEIFAERLGEMNYDLKVRVFADSEQLMEGMNLMISRRDTDAFVLMGNEDLVEKQGILLEKSDIPFVANGRFESLHPAWNQVDYDHEAMMSKAVGHLSAIGHRRIAYMGFESDATFAKRLFDGYSSALAKVGVELHPGWIANTDATVESVEVAAGKLLCLPQSIRPTALVIANGNHAWHIVEKCLALHGIYMGEKTGEFSVAGMCVGPVSLSFGEAVAYQEISFGQIASAMFDRCLVPIIKREPISTPIVRVCPPLTPIYSRHELQFVQLKTTIYPS